MKSLTGCCPEGSQGRKLRAGKREVLEMQSSTMGARGTCSETVAAWQETVPGNMVQEQCGWWAREWEG